MEDRFTRGFVAGVIGGIATNAWSLLAGAMGWTTLRTVDLMGLFIYAHLQPFDLAEVIFGLFGHLIVSAVLGVGFVYLLQYLDSLNHLLKGWTYSVTFWFLVYSITALFQFPGTIPLPLKTAFSDFIGATIFGLVLPLALRALATKEIATSLGISMAPAMKPLDHENDENKLH